MAEITLVIGNRNYSSWSLRPWIALRAAELPFDVVTIPLNRPETAGRIGEYSAAGRVPVLRHGALTVWDSLAICEYVAELAPAARLWPENPATRAVARSVSAEMHAGFAALRAGLPMNIRADRPGVPVAASVRADIDRILQIWRDCRAAYGADGPFLFGAFSIADAMFAPVAWRFRTYQVVTDGPHAGYIEAICGLPAMQEWYEKAVAEEWVIESEEVYGA